MPPKTPPPSKSHSKRALNDPTPTASSADTTPQPATPPVVLLKTNETNSMNDQSPVVSKKKTVKKVVKVIVKKLVKKRVPKVGSNQKSEALVEDGVGEGIDNGSRVLEGIGEMGCLDSGVGGSGLVEDAGKINSLVSNSVIDGDSCGFGGNLDQKGNVPADTGNSRVVQNFESKKGNGLAEDVGKVCSLASNSVINEGLDNAVPVGRNSGLTEAGLADEVGNIGSLVSNLAPECASCDVGVSMLTEGDIPVEVENLNGMEAMSVEGTGNIDSSVSDSVIENKICDLDVMEVENMGIVGTCEKGKEGPVSGGHVDCQEDGSLIVKSNFAGEISIENEGLIDGKSDEFRNEAVVERGEDAEGRKEEVDKSIGVIMGNAGLVLSGELGAMERRRRRKTEIFIGGLDKNATKEDVRKVFEEVGEITEVRMWINEKTGKNKGYAFVRFASAADAKKALQIHPKIEICGKQCSTAPVEGNDTIFLGNINKKWKNDDVIKLLKDIEIEKIDKVTVMVDPNNAERNRGFAFIEFETNKDAKTAFKKLQEDLPVNFQNLKIAWAEPLNEADEEELQKVKSVYVEYLPSSWNEEKVRNCFKKFGEIENVVLARNLHSSRRKDFAFVNFVTREAALACIESSNHGMVDDEGNEVNVKVSIAKPLPKGKSLKKVSKSTSQEIPKQKSKAVERIAKPTQPRNKGVATAHFNKGVAKAEFMRPIEHGNKRGPAIQIGGDRAVDARTSDRVVDPRISHRVDDARTLHSTDLEQILAERALHRQMQSRFGLTNSNQPSVSPGSKRSFSASAEDLYHPESRRHTRMRTETSFPVGRENMQVDDPYHPIPRGYTRLQAESSFPVGNRNVQTDYLYHPDPSGLARVHAENSFPVRSPKMQGDDLFHPDPRMYSHLHAETGADDPYHHDPRGHALVHGEKYFPGRSPNLQADDLLHQRPIGYTRVHPENTLPGGSLSRSEAAPGLGVISPYRRQTPDYASASDYRGKDYAYSFHVWDRHI